MACSCAYWDSGDHRKTLIAYPPLATYTARFRRHSYGPPGTGKTLLARAVATAFDGCFLPLAIPDVLKSLVRDVYGRALLARPTLTKGLFDDYDSMMGRWAKASVPWRIIFA